ncbi:MAG TPA: hypothetical protein VK966_08080, partial [Longimicrobiales bacterium]|nr:hypothetical protein [Longimicrobiales bacterium]
ATLMLASFGAGATTVRSVATAKAVPEQISELQDTDLRHDAALDTLRATYLDLNRKVDRVLCLVEAQADVRHFSECVR